MRSRSLLVATVLMVAACGGGATTGQDPQATVSTFGQFVDRADLPTVVYDGETCSYIGPEAVESGPVRMTLDNRGDTRARMDILRFPEGKTLEDLVDYVESGEAEANQSSPDWVTQTRKVRAPANQVITANRTLFDNTYGILCYLGDEEPFRVEAVATFEVTEA